MKVLIIEDDKFSVQLLMEMLEKHQLHEKVQVAYTLSDAHKKLHAHDFDLLFLDVHLKDGKGTDIINDAILGEQVIFTTSDPEYAVKAFEINALDYLLKPYSAERFDLAVQRIREANPENNHIVIRADYKFHKLKISDIRYIKSNGDYLTLHTADKNYTFYGRLKKIIQRLPAEQFKQCHRSFIVNLKMVTGYQNGELQIGEEVVPVSNSYKREISAFFGQ